MGVKASIFGLLCRSRHWMDASPSEHRSVTALNRRLCELERHGRGRGSARVHDDDMHIAMDDDPIHASSSSSLICRTREVENATSNHLRIRKLAHNRSVYRRFTLIFAKAWLFSVDLCRICESKGAWKKLHSS
ncbi:hypothetical protein LOK49_LG04G02886 [Camellia lanceoleosa]|uniref:Uncharacterized protein n=1 Tax=Camellia lanceoleosa TaxID=1840588 RepID=A0ACC0HZA2_9ERIC|nr:hypothetical protein LOK49_LG04G02886 [Camellia lanceoleosa]